MIRSLNAHVLENRQYLGFDDSLRTGPYNFGSLDTKPDWVEHFSYQDGLLISYGTRRTPTTASATTRAAGSCCRWTPTRTSSTGPTGR